MKKLWRKRGTTQNQIPDCRDLEWIRWEDAVVGQVRFSPDRKAIRKELYAHYEDRVRDLERLGYAHELAMERSRKAMGSAWEVGCALDQTHHPFLGWLWQFTRGLVAVLLVTAAVVFFKGNGMVNDAVLRTQKQLAWTEPAAGADRVETEHATLWLAPGEVTEADGRIQAELHLWIEMRDPFGYSPLNAAGAFQFSDDRGNIPPKQYRQVEGEWPEVGYWESVQGSDISWTRYQWTLRLVLDHKPQWVVVTYPYGGNDWTLRAEWEETT
ncbi:hypothetical protein [Dysosmobacter sp.]|uniref:hypothetical protein n=1 Tax=Dysosmobacter sp. TaxID=2591382 RepID=UPI002A8EB2A3|nr:hypothetical protein [Dysosmobacter sp.]MDY3986062.1 hypothetical protein [Dysosmobacter sp.]